MVLAILRTRPEKRGKKTSRECLIEMGSNWLISKACESGLASGKVIKLIYIFCLNNY